jgi:hypothetical protein
MVIDAERRLAKAKRKVDGLEKALEVFRRNADYGQHDAAAKYSPGKIMEVISKVRDGRRTHQHVLYIKNILSVLILKAI